MSINRFHIFAVGVETFTNLDSCWYQRYTLKSVLLHLLLLGMCQSFQACLQYVCSIKLDRLQGYELGYKHRASSDNTGQYGIRT